MMTDDYSDDYLVTDSLDDLDVGEDVSMDDAAGDDEFPDNDVIDIDKQMEQVYGNVPKPGRAFSMADEVEKDELERRGID